MIFCWIKASAFSEGRNRTKHKKKVNSNNSKNVSPASKHTGWKTVSNLPISNFCQLRARTAVLDAPQVFFTSILTPFKNVRHMRRLHFLLLKSLLLYVCFVTLHAIICLGENWNNDDFPQRCSKCFFMRVQRKYITRATTVIFGRQIFSSSERAFCGPSSINKNIFKFEAALQCLCNTQQNFCAIYACS